MNIYYAYWNEYFGYKFSITPDIVSRLPQWPEDAAFPPLSPRIAISNSRLAVQRLLVEVVPFEPRFGACSLVNRGCWYYIVSWYVPDLEDPAVDWSEFSLPVFFDGSVPEPMKFKYEDRFDVYR
jgi:hypothetical protein